MTPPTNLDAATSASSTSTPFVALPSDAKLEEPQSDDPSTPNPPTIGFIIPFPEYIGAHALGADRKKSKTTSDDIPPFIIYHPPLARLKKPEQGEKESIVNKATRKWQEEEDEAKGRTGLKAKTVNVSLQGKLEVATGRES